MDVTRNSVPVIDSVMMTFTDYHKKAVAYAESVRADSSGVMLGGPPYFGSGALCYNARS